MRSLRLKLVGILCTKVEVAAPSHLAPQGGSAFASVALGVYSEFGNFCCTALTSSAYIFHKSLDAFYVPDIHPSLTI